MPGCKEKRGVLGETRNLIETGRNETRNTIEQTMPVARPASVCWCRQGLTSDVFRRPYKVAGKDFPPDKMQAAALRVFSSLYASVPRAKVREVHEVAEFFSLQQK